MPPRVRHKRAKRSDVRQLTLHEFHERVTRQRASEPPGETTARVYRYGVRWDRESIALLREHIARCDRMYNDLAAEVNGLLREREACIAAACPEYARLQDELSFVDRTRNPHFTAAQRKALVVRLRDELSRHAVPSHVYREADALVKERWPGVRARVNAAHKDVLCWTHRGAIDRAVEAAGKGRKTGRSSRQVRTWGYRIRARESDGTGTIGGQTYVTAGFSTRDVFSAARGGRLIVQIGDGEPVTLPNGRAARRHVARMPIRLRIATGVYLTGTVTLHRELPSTGTVKEIRLSRGLEGSRQSHHVLLTVTGIAAPARGQEVAGLDVGWAAEGEALTAGALALPRSDVVIRPPALDKLDWVDELKSATDREQDALRDGLAASIAQRGELPEHLRYLARWRSPERLAGLATDEALSLGERDQVRAWLYHRRHRLDAMAGARTDALVTRDQYYHGLVRDMVRAGVGHLAVEAGVLAAFSRREKDVQGTRSQRQRARCALSNLVRYAESAGIRVVEVPARNTSKQCSHCGEQHEGARDGRSYACPACGVLDHADINAARNIRMRGIERLRDGSGAAPARKAKKPSRSARFQAARKARTDAERRDAAE